MKQRCLQLQLSTLETFQRPPAWPCGSQLGHLIHRAHGLRAMTSWLVRATWAPKLQSTCKNTFEVGTWSVLATK